jgi:ankyrin repeat protein
MSIATDNHLVNLESKLFVNTQTCLDYKIDLYRNKNELIITNGYIKFFNILKKSPNELVKQLTSFLHQYMYIEKKSIKHILIESEIYKNKDIIQSVFNSIASYNCVCNLINIIELLVEFGADINHPIDNYGNTLLHKISYSGNNIICNYLIKKGCNITLLNLGQKSPLDVFGEVFDSTLRKYTNLVKDEYRLLFTKEYNWIKRRNYILFVNGVKKLFSEHELINYSLYKIIHCHDLIRYIATYF